MARGTGQNPETVSLIVRKALSAVARVHRKFGLQAAANLLRGAVDERLERSGLVATPTFGALKEYDAPWLMKLLRRCIVAGWADFSEGDKPLAVLTEAGRRVMKGEAPVRLILPPLQAPRLPGVPSSSPPRNRKEPAAAADEVVLDPAGLALFQRLRAHRLQLANRDSVPPYVVASDRSLRDLAVLRPKTRDQLLMAHGIGPAKADKYGAELLAVIAAFRSGAAG
jgi:ATP-dependent DNA helicase RecQ